MDSSVIGQRYLNFAQKYNDPGKFSFFHPTFSLSHFLLIMTPLFKKLNFKDHAAVVVLQQPDSFTVEMENMAPFAKVSGSFEASYAANFVLAFALKQSEVDAFAHDFATKTTGDAVLWIAYPKSTSKRYKCDFNRDTGWAVLGTLGFEPVRQVAIDEDWSALRFRRVDFIKTMTRSFAMTESGKTKTQAATSVLPMPDDFQSALNARPDAAAFFEKLAPSHKKEYIRWIESAKRAETRTSRLEKALEMLTMGKKIS
jgi:hypothetical protein